MSTIASHSSFNMSETVRDKTLGSGTTNRKWLMGNQMVT